MIFVLSALHGIALVFALAIAPFFWFLTYLYRKHYRNVEFEWKRAELNVMAIVCFGFNLGLFVASCFFFAGYLKRTHLDIIHISSESMGLLCFDCILAFMGITLVYVGLQNIFSQRICRQGIVEEKLSFQSFRGIKKYITWGEIKDYYIQPSGQSSPITRFQFIVSKDGYTYSRKSLDVPFYALCQFETLLEMNLKKRKEELKQENSTHKHTSRNMTIED